MDPFTIFFIVWLIVLPIAGMIFIVFGPIFWFLIVPKIARTLTWNRFRKVHFHFISDDVGFAHLVPSTTEVIPEGVVRAEKFGYRLLPRLTSGGNPDGDNLIKRLLLRKYIWADMGKPIWFDYAGKVGSFNPATLAILEQSQGKNPVGKPDVILNEMSDYVKALPKALVLKDKTYSLREDLAKMLERLKTEITIQELTVMDPSVVKSLLPTMYTPSQLKALALNREQYGMEKRGKEYGRLILGGGLIIAILIFGIVALVLITK